MIRVRTVAAGVTLALSAFCLATTGTAIPALAGNACNPNRIDTQQANYDGWLAGHSPSVGGIYSNILNEPAWVISTPGSASTSWTMLNNGGSWWAQVGSWTYSYGGGNGNGHSVFVQFTATAGSYTTHFFAASPIGQYTYYTTLWNNTPGKFTFQVAGSTIDTETANFTPTGGQNFSEIATLANQMPGGYASPEDFTSTHWYINGGWTGFNAPLLDSNTNYFNIAQYGAYDLQTGDKACP